MKLDANIAQFLLAELIALVLIWMIPPTVLTTFTLPHNICATEAPVWRSVYAASRCEYKLQFGWRSRITPRVYGMSIHYWWKEINQFDVWVDVLSCRVLIKWKPASALRVLNSCMYWLEIRGEGEGLSHPPDSPLFHSILYLRHPPVLNITLSTLL